MKRKIGACERELTRRVWVAGWILDNDLSSQRRATNGWAGCMSITRVLSQHVLPNVVSAVSPGLDLQNMPNVVATPAPSGTPGGPQTFLVETLGLEPVAEFEQLRTSKPLVRLADQDLSTLALGSVGIYWELQATIAFDDPNDGKLSILLRHTEGEGTTPGCGTVAHLVLADKSEYTEVIFDSPKAGLTAVRERSTLDASGINTASHHGAFTLYNVLQQDGAIRPEPLHLRIICDNSVVEIFANGRFALSTRIYPSRIDATGLTVQWAPNDGKPIAAHVGVKLQDLTVWETKTT